MKTGILTFEQFRGQKNLGSSRIRGHWLANQWEDAELFVQGQKYDVVIYQKSYLIQHAKHFEGIKIFDVCDPEFLHWGYQTVEMIEECDAVTTSTESLAEAIRHFTDKPVVCIPDRIDLEHIKRKKYHKGDAQWVAWYGYSTNFDMLKPVIPVLKKLNLNLKVISDSAFNPSKAYSGFDFQNLPFSWDTLYDDLLDCDIVVNPKSGKGKWKYKSNNKSILAWALGLPVALNLDDLKKFKPEVARREEQQLRYKELEEKWDIKYSIEEYKELIDSIKK